MTMTTNDVSKARQDAAQAGRREAEDDFARFAANRANGLELPADGALRNAWLAAYAARFAELAAPYADEGRLIAAGRKPLFHAGQRIEFTRFDDLALNRDNWVAGEVYGYFEPRWQPLATVSRWLQLEVRVLGKRGGPVGKPIEISECQVRVPQDVTP
jgi:hypothetical protein